MKNKHIKAIKEIQKLISNYKEDTDNPQWFIEMIKRIIKEDKL
jgi:hypothetical protein